MEKMFDKIKEASDYIKGLSDNQPKIGIILGTGLGSLADGIEVSQKIEYDNIPHFPVSTVESHHGRLLCGQLEGKDVIAMQGRFHFYEGYSMQQVTFPVRVMAALGVETLIVSNACGGLNPQFIEGDLVVITDHVNMLGDNPLIGLNDDRLGPRFPDMYNCYDQDLVKLARQVALEMKIPIQKGVYIAVSGPNLETAAEYRYLRIIGGDVVGMSTVPEAIVARHQGMKTLGISIITDMGLPDAIGPCSIEKVLAIAGKAEPKLRALIGGVVKKL